MIASLFWARLSQVRGFPGGLGGVLCAGFLLLSSQAQAGPCSALPNPVVIESGDTQQPLLKQLGRQLRDADPPVTLVYRTTGTCTVINDSYTAAKVAENSNLLFAPSTTEDPTWDSSMVPSECTVDTAGGIDIDLGIAATFVSSCTTDPPPAGKALFNGPVQGYGFIIPRASSQVALTAEEGYFAFGFGNAGEIDPWNDEQFLFIRTPTKSTALTLGAAVGVPAARLKGEPFDKSTEVLNAVVTATQPEKAIGLMGIEIYDANRDTVKLLAFRAFKQRYAYYPDSTSTSFDKQNLRDGHYLPWSPTVYIAAVDGSGVPSNPDAKLVLDLVLGHTTLPGLDGLATVISKGLIPDCAMKVQRDFDGADLSLYQPDEPCDCFYEANVPGGTTACTACTSDDQCEGKCRHGYCEAR